MTDSKELWVCVTHIEALRARVFVMPAAAKGRWQIGIPGSGAAIEIDEPMLSGLDLYCRAASNHVLLEGRVDDRALLPPLGLCTLSSEHGWDWVDPMPWEWTLRKGRLYVRFDYHWLRIGGHALRLSWDRADLDQEPRRVAEPIGRPWWRKLFGGARSIDAKDDERSGGGPW